MDGVNEQRVRQNHVQIQCGTSLAHFALLPSSVKASKKKGLDP